MYSYLFAQPPYLLLLFGILISVSCGTAFQKVLKENVKQWYNSKEQNQGESLQTLSLFVPFLGICGGIFTFLAAGLQIVINNWLISSAISLPLTLLTGRLVWSQLRILLSKLQEGGSQALDLDNIF
ncbi:hypothetical protein [Dactylococcopsis salina]|uniref:MotA/TolQ/ExbB proton channel domain-containing protein n=1 Tax=Dactylococcopsis salina (strain PCC 8305) TaxID=13035 RepID=K9YSF9_DACS8|nr:hypothetical protein [Dactylococcopsis salina]AFZ49265.1 hypothetical protein Dacsa_0478 [Dactylococcopsis salina PCC 8305]